MARPHYDTYGAKAKALRRKAKATKQPCWICGKPIDYTLHWKHPMSFTADHVQPIANGGDPNGELRPAHRSCNSRRSNKPTNLRTIATPSTSRAW